MDKKGEIGIGVLMLTFISVLVGLILLQAVAPNIGQATNSYSYTTATKNYTTTLPAANGSKVWLNGQDLLSTPTVYNMTGALTWGTGNYTIAEGVNPTTGVKGIYLQADRFPNAALANPVNITYEYGSDGYINNSGGRAMANLILIFFAMAVLGVVLYPVIKERFLD